MGSSAMRHAFLFLKKTVLNRPRDKKILAGEVSAMRQKGADALLTGSISRMNDGRYDVRVRLWDVVRGQDLGAMSYVVVTGDLRLASHKISDDCLCPCVWDFVFHRLQNASQIDFALYRSICSCIFTFNCC